MSSLHSGHALCQGFEAEWRIGWHVSATSKGHKPRSLASRHCCVLRRDNFALSWNHFFLSVSSHLYPLSSGRSSLTARSLGIMELRCSL